MPQQPRERTMPSHTVINDRYPHGVVEKVTAEGVWLKGGTRWYHFNRDMMKGQTLPKIGAYVVMTEDQNGQITHVAMQHELQQLSAQQPEQPTTETTEPDSIHKRLAKYRSEQRDLTEPVSLVEHRIRTDALALAIQLLYLELRTDIDRGDIYRVAQNVIRWIKNGEGK